MLKKLLIIFVLICIFTSACYGGSENKNGSISGPPASSASLPGNPPESYSESSEESPASKAPRNPLAPYPPKPTAEQIMDYSYWRDNWLPLSISFQPVFKRGQNSAHYNASYLGVAAYLAHVGYLDRYEDCIMPFGDFLYYAGKLFGEENADPAIYTDQSMADLIDIENQIIHITKPHSSYLLPNDRLDMETYGWFLMNWECVSIESYTEDGAGKVKLVIAEYDDAEHKKLYRYETYIYVWDDEVGFVVESSSWHWPETNRVSLVGGLKKLDSMAPNPDGWNFSSSSIGGAYSNMFQTSTIAQKTYNIFLSGSRLRCHIFDFDTEQAQYDAAIHDFSGEKVLGWDCLNDSIVVRTDKAVYRFGGDLKLESRKELPVEAGHYTVNAEMTMIAFSDEQGINICKLEPGARPELLDTHPVNIKSDNMREMMGNRTLYPMRFVSEYRLFAGISAWESSDGYVDYDLLSGTKTPIEQLVLGYGSHTVSNQDGILFAHAYHGATEQTGHFYYSWSDKTLESASWLPKDAFTEISTSWDSPGHQYFGITSGPYDEPDKTGFYKIDYSTRNVTELPFFVNGAEARIIGASEDGKLLVWYGYKGESGYCLYTLE